MSWWSRLGPFRCSLTPRAISDEAGGASGRVGWGVTIAEINEFAEQTRTVSLSSGYFGFGGFQAGLLPLDVRGGLGQSNLPVPMPQARHGGAALGGT